MIDTVSTIQRLAGAHSLEEVTGIVTSAVRSTLAAGGATFVLRDEGRCYYVDENAISPLWKGRRFPLQTCISGWCMLHSQSVRIADIFRDERIPADAYRPTFVRSLAMAPIRSSDPIGAIGAYWPEGHLASDEELQYLQTIADSASVALKNVELISSLRAAHDQVTQLQRLQAVGQLAAVVAHDFNNLLVPILGYCELLSAELMGQDHLYRMVIEVENAADRARAISQQLLAFARKQPLKPVHVDLNEILRDLERLLRRLAGSQASIAFDLSASPQIVNVDRGHIDQVLLNLVANARDAMPDGGQITIATQTADAPSGAPGDLSVRLTVSDTGMGMSPEVQQQAFEPFFTTKEAGRGTGLGLSTVYGIVQQNGGTIALRSVPGQGTTFEICLPCVRDPALAKTAKRAALPDGSETLLIVEDDSSVRNLAEILLRTQGYDVLAVGTGGEAWSAVDEMGKHFDLVLIDMGLPDTSGRQLAQRIRGRRAFPIILMSGHPPDYIVQGKERSQDLFLEKPFTRETLLCTVRKAIDARTSA